MNKRCGICYVLDECYVTLVTFMLNIVVISLFLVYAKLKNQCSFFNKELVGKWEHS